jgi:minor extracellular serine protease Vpr
VDGAYLFHVAALSIGPNTFVPTFLTGFASVAFDIAGAPVTSVTVPSGGLAKLVETSVVKQSDGATFTMHGGDMPYFLFHLDHQARRLRLEVSEAGTGNSGVRRSAGNTSPVTPRRRAYSQLRGTVEATFAGRRTYTVPDGTDTVTLSGVKALGSESNPAHVETWTSPSFTIARPSPPPTP